MGVRSLMPFRSSGLYDGAHVVGDVAEAVLPEAEDLIALGGGSLLEHIAHLHRDALHVVAALDDVGHLEHAEGIGDGTHHRGRQGELHLAELQLLQQLLVVAELRGAEDLHFRRAFQLLVGATGELVGRGLEQRAGLAHMPELEDGLGLGRGGGERDSGACHQDGLQFHVSPPWFVVWLGDDGFCAADWKSEIAVGGKFHSAASRPSAGAASLLR